VANPLKMDFSDIVVNLSLRFFGQKLRKSLQIENVAINLSLHFLGEN
jgi:hypothetical protein